LQQSPILFDWIRKSLRHFRRARLSMRPWERCSAPRRKRDCQNAA